MKFKYYSVRVKWLIIKKWIKYPIDSHEWVCYALNVRFKQHSKRVTWIIREAIRSTAKARFAVLPVENTKYGHKTDVRDTTDSPLACKVDNRRDETRYEISRYKKLWKKDTIKLFYYFIRVINAIKKFPKRIRCSKNSHVYIFKKYAL